MLNSQFLPAGTDKLVSGIIQVGWDAALSRNVAGVAQAITPALVGGLALKTNIGALTSALTGSLNLGALASIGAIASFNPAQLGQILPAALNLSAIAPSALSMAQSIGGSIGGLNPASLLSSSTALAGLSSLSFMNTGVTPLLSSMGQFGGISSALSAGMSALGGVDKVLGSAADTFLSAQNSFSSLAQSAGASLGSALLGKPQLLDGNTQSVLSMASSINTMVGVMRQNSGNFYGSSQGTQLINQVGSMVNLAGSIGQFGQSAASLATGAYSNPLGLVKSLAGAMSFSGSPLAGSGSLLGGIGGLAQGATAISAEALVACGFGNSEVYEKYDRKPTAMSDPGFWTGKRPTDDPAKKGVYNMGDFMGSQEAQQEVFFRQNRQNFNTMVSRGLLDASVDPQKLGGFMSVGFFNVADAFGIKVGGIAGTNAYGMNIASVFAASVPGVAKVLGAVAQGAAIVNNVLNSVSGFPGVSQLLGGVGGGANSLAYTVGNLLQSPHMLSSQIYNYLQAPDTNRLARGTEHYDRTPSNNYDSTRSMGIPKPDGSKWNMPESAFNANYPHNVTRQTTSGMVEEFDGTPTSTRYHLYHPSGTRVEIDNAGVKSEKINSDRYVEVTGNDHVFVKGAKNLVVEGVTNIVVKDKVNMVVHGEVNGEFRNDVNLTISGSMNAIAKEAFRVKAREIQLEAYDISMKAEYGLYDESKRRSSVIGEGGYDISGKGVAISMEGLSVKIAKDFRLLAEGSVELVSEKKTVIGSVGELIVASTGDLNLRSKSKTRVISEDVLYLSSSGAMHEYRGGTKYVVSIPTVIGAQRQSLTTQRIEVTPAKNDEIKPVKSVNPKVFIDLDKIEKRANPSSPPPPTPYSKSKSERDSVYSEREGASGSGATPVPASAQPSNQPTSPPSGKIVDASEFASIINGDEIGDRVYSMRLSENFLVRHLTKDLGHNLRAQNGLTAAQILTNLKTLAENVLEPLYKKYAANLIITSGFRDERKVKNKSSQHCKGQAIDVQHAGFKKQSRSDYEKFRSEILSTVNGYDQCILEQATSGSHWIHVSYNAAGNRRSVFNMTGQSGSA